MTTVQRPCRPREPAQSYTSHVQDTLTYSKSTRPSNGRHIHSRDWRANRSQCKDDVAPSHISVRTSAGLNVKKAKEMTRENCRIGMIFRAVLHEEDTTCLRAGAPTQDEHTTVTRDFGDIYSKMRWMIVVKVNRVGYTAIPLYTYNGKGLERKNATIKAEYVSVHDLRNPPCTPQSHHRPVQARMLDKSTVLKAMTVAHLVHNINKQFGLPIQEEGRLTEKSLEEFLELYDNLNRASRR